MKNRFQEKIAIVGMGFSFPGADRQDIFWQNILHRKDSKQKVPAGRWQIEVDEVIDGSGRLDRIRHDQGYFVTKTYEDQLRPLLLEKGIEFSQLDPACHLLLKAGIDAYADAKMSDVAKDKIGLIVGQIALPTVASSQLVRSQFETSVLKSNQQDHVKSYKQNWLAENQFVASFPIQLLGRCLDLGGITYGLDAACASSLYAIKLAVDELLSGRVDGMLAGGVSRPDSLFTQMGFTQLQALSPGATCRPFDKDGDGLMVGEGAGLFVLKRLHDALAHGDRIYGLIAGCGLSNDSSAGLMAPSSRGQVQAMEQAYHQAGWLPWDIDYIECHATGTPLGDQVELQSLAQLWNEAPSGKNVVLGSVKSNCGHLLTAAGASGMARVLLGMQHRVLPPTTNFISVKQQQDSLPHKFEILREPQPWPVLAERPQRAAVSGFGFGGINAHLLIESYEGPKKDSEKTGVQLFSENPRKVVIVAMAVKSSTIDDLQSLREQLCWPKENDESGSATVGKIEGENNDSLGIALQPFEWRPQGFKIPPREWDQMLGQQQLILKLSHDVMDSLLLGEDIRGQMGCFVGLELDPATNYFSLRWDAETYFDKNISPQLRDLSNPNRNEVKKKYLDSVWPPLTADRTIGSLASIAASRIAKQWSFGGPSYTVAAGMQSGLIAFQNAYQAICRGEILGAVVGAVDFTSSPAVINAYKKISERFLLKSSTSSGDGAVVMVLWNQEDALKRGLEILADVDALEYVDAVSTNGLVVDPSLLPLDQFPQLGAANGLFGLACAVVQMSQRIKNWGLAPAYWMKSCVSENIGLQYTSQTPLEQKSIGVKISATDSKPHICNALPQNKYLLTLKSETPEGLKRQLQQFAEVVHSNSKRPRHESFNIFYQNLPPIISPSEEFRLSAVMDDKNDFTTILADLSQAIDQFVLGARIDGHGGIFISDVSKGRGLSGSLAFMYPGTGHAYQGMGQQFSLAFAEILEGLDVNESNLAEQFAAETFWGGDSIDFRQANTKETIAAQVAYGHLVTNILQRIGLRSEFAFGYSLGESSLYLAHGVWRDRQGLLRHLKEMPLFREQIGGSMHAVKSHWNLKDSDSVDWGTFVVRSGPSEIEALLTNGLPVYLMNINTPKECVIGGDRGAAMKFIAKLNCSFMEIPGVAAIHCPVVNQVIDEYRAFHQFEVYPVHDLKVLGGRSGILVEQSSEGVLKSLEEQAIHGVDFPAFVERAYQLGVRYFVDIGPGAGLRRMVDEILGDKPYKALAVCKHARSELDDFYLFCAEMFSYGFDVDPFMGAKRQAKTETPVHKSPQLSLKVKNVVPNLSHIAFLQGELNPGVEKTTEQTLERKPNPTVASPPTHSKNNKDSLRRDFTMIQKKHGESAKSLPGQDLFEGMIKSQDALIAAHNAYLQNSEKLFDTMISLTSDRIGADTSEVFSNPLVKSTQDLSLNKTSVFMDYEQCLTFARGRIGDVLGSRFAAIDRFPTRVRLPDEPLMLCHRIMEVNAEPLSMSHGKMVTEHDVLPDAWYLDHGRIPTCIAVEAGQADLFLSAYLGVDFKTKGKAVYRLLDAQVVFHSSLPMPGDVIRYEISLHEFFYQGDMILFRFSFDASVDGKPLMSMAQGCAGFFTEEDLAMGRGVVRPTIATQARVGKIVGDFQSFVKDPPSQLDEGNLDALRRGDYVGCYGDLFADLSLKDPSGLPGDKMRLVHRIKDLEPTGGMYRLGRIVGEADIHPGDWFLTCHFVDDMVMPGTLMYECCLHTLRVFLMGCGWVGERDQMVCEPVPGVVSQLKCRGQVTADTKVVTYEIVVKEIGYRPQAYAIVDALMYADGKPIVDIRDMSLQYPHLNQHSLTNLWDKQKAKIDDAMDLHFMSEQILAFSQSDPTDCFGELYAPFCEGTQRRFARLPRPPYLFLTEAYGRSHDLGVMKAGGNIHGLYRINPAAWYFKSDQSGIMPFAVLLEVGLQTCGFFAAFMGSALTQDDDMFFRNLDGRGTLHRHVKPNDMEITTKVQTTKVVSSGAMIIQEYHFSMFVDHQLVYEGTTNFGFFTRQALGQQSGIVKRQGWLNTASFEKSKLAPFPEGSGLPVGVLLMLDGIDILSIQGGRYGRGFIRGIKEVDPKDWFFQAHFFQDPVMPGTLGLEGAIQALKVFAFEIWGNKRAMEPILGEVHQWSYRGQVLQNSKIMTVEMHVKDIDHDTRTILADGLVSVDGTVIYGVDDFGLRESH